jgi:hypothetical protein
VTAGRQSYVGRAPLLVKIGSLSRRVSVGDLQVSVQSPCCLSWATSKGFILSESVGLASLLIDVVRIGQQMRIWLPRG